MIKFHDDKGSKVAPTPNSSSDFDVIWETKTFQVQTSSATMSFPIKVLHGYRRYNIDHVVSPEVGHETVLAVHGVMHNALVFEPLGHELLKDLNRKTNHVYSISLPGHGDTTSGSSHGVSGIPDQRLYGDVTLEDYAEALTQVTEQIGRVDTIVAHSQGGIVVQLAEEKLQSAGSSFRSATQSQTNRIVLIASTTPVEVPWYASDNGYLAPILGSLNAVTTASGKGIFISITDSDWHSLFYSYPALSSPPVPVAGGPNLITQVPRLRTDEPSVASFNSLGLMQPRPSIPANLFSSYTFHNIAFQDDEFLTPVDLDGLGNYLKPGAGHILIASQSGAIAIHCALYTRPASLVPYLVGRGDEI